MDLKEFIASGIIVIIIAAYSFLMGRLYTLIEIIRKDVEKIKKSLPVSEEERMKKRCSIMWCPWKAKYGFGMKNYYECWFHGGDMPWLGTLWNILTRPIYFFYNWMKHRVCLGVKGLKWKLY